MYFLIKRAFDIFLVIFFAPIWLPLMGIVAVLVKCGSAGPVFFTQKRYGRQRRFFMIYKFRSMYTTAPADMPTHMLQNPAAFITPIGRVLRSTSLDELPQLLNIIKGELSIVGPRPALWNQDDLIAEREKYDANAVPVGLTGLAQVSGRDALSIEEKAACDGEYAKRRSFFFDLWIMMRTVFYVMGRKGISEGGPRN